MSRRTAAQLLTAALLGGAAGAGAAEDEGQVVPGAYCPLPARGEKPRCLEPAVARYGEFFEAVEEGRADGSPLARVEETVAAGGSSEEAYLALSSLAYGYYRLSQRAAATPETPPEIAARLERWNALLGQAYGTSEDDAWRAAVREAALDLQQRAPPVGLSCRDARGEPTACDSTDAVLRGVDATADEVGIRGGLRRLLERISAEEDS